MTEENKTMSAEEILKQVGGKVVENDGWEDVGSEMGKTVRWKAVASNEKEAEKTVYIGDTVHGLYHGKRENIGENGATMYQVKTVEHGLLNIWDTTVLSDKMKRVYEGNEIKIIARGERKPKTGGKSYFVFDVLQRPASEELLKALNEREKTINKEMEEPKFN